MTTNFRLTFVAATWFAGSMAWTNAAADGPIPTREFEIRNDRAFLGGHEVDLWGLRCGNALHSEAITERHVRNLDNMATHGINLIGVYIQGATRAGRISVQVSHVRFQRVAAPEYHPIRAVFHFSQRAGGQSDLLVGHHTWFVGKDRPS